MSITSTRPKTPGVDPALIAAVVRRVIARLNSGSPEPGPVAAAVGEESSGDAVISVATINELSAATEVLQISSTAIVTPAARDEAKLNGVQIQREVGAVVAGRQDSAVSGVSSGAVEIIDRDATGIGQAVTNQLRHRGISPAGGATLVLTSRPAAEVISQCRSGTPAIVVRSVGDVDRFAAETAASVFVIDSVESNLIAAVNIAARIYKSQGGSR